MVLQALQAPGRRLDRELPGNQVVAGVAVGHRGDLPGLADSPHVLQEDDLHVSRLRLLPGATRLQSFVHLSSGSRAGEAASSGVPRHPQHDRPECPATSAS